TANVTFVVAEADDTTVVPNAALRFRPPASDEKKGQGQHKPHAAEEQQPRDPSQKSVYVLRGLPAKLTRVKGTVGVTDGTTTQITSDDLKEGDQVVTDLTSEGAPKPQAAQAPRGGRML